MDTVSDKVRAIYPEAHAIQQEGWYQINCDEFPLAYSRSLAEAWEMALRTALIRKAALAAGGE